MPTAPVPSRIGRYATIRVLGEGGMGTVYEAQQESPKRTVALKVIRAGYLSPELLRRFTQESQVLGRLQHPGIAQVYEAGTVDDERGQRTPFFAMEFIRGVPLTEYASQKKLGTRERLELVARICDAVYHAHQKGVIHRDLKPGNIVVDESGQPKVLDFGIARATDSDVQQTTLQTDIGQLVGTIPYMSPEQVSGDPGDLDTRSDVYALGVIAYELLAGRLPYALQRKMIHEAARIIKEEEPTRLSSINRTLKGDVETIVAKALEKDKIRRYQSAESLASDIRRYLKDEPIAARPASTWYQAGKFAKRNKGLVSGLAAAFMLLIAGLAGTSYGLRQAVAARDNEAAARRDADIQRDAAIAARSAEEAQRKTAEAQRDKAEKIAEFMSDTLKGAGPSVALGRDITMLKEMMDVATARIEKGDLKDTPEAEVRLRLTIGSTYTDLAAYDTAIHTLEPAVSLARQLYGAAHANSVYAMNQLANAYSESGRLDESLSLFQEALAVARGLSPPDDARVALALHNLASVKHAVGDLAGAEQLFRESLTAYERVHRGDHEDVARGMANLSQVLADRGDADGALRLQTDSVHMLRRVIPGDHPFVAAALANLASQLQENGDPVTAEACCGEALEMGRRLWQGDHPVVAGCLHNMARFAHDRGDLKTAESLFREALEMFRKLVPRPHPDTAALLSGLAGVVQDRGNLLEAEALSRESLQILDQVFPTGHPSTAQVLSNTATILQEEGKLEEAETMLRRSLEMARGVWPGDHESVALALYNLGYVVAAQGRPLDAEPFLEQALEMRRHLEPTIRDNMLDWVRKVAELRESLGKHVDAESLWKEVFAACSATLPEGNWLTADAMSRIGGSRLSQGRFAEAESPLIDGFNGLAGALDTPRIPEDYLRQAGDRIVTLYEFWDKAEPGKGYDTKAAEWKAKLEAIATPPAPAPKPSASPSGG